MPKENRNPPKQLTGPQGMTTLLAESNERFARLEEKLDTLADQMANTLAALLERLTDISSAMVPAEETADTPTEEAEGKVKSKAKK